MAKHGKKYRDALARVDRETPLNFEDAVALCKSVAYASFDESIDAAFNLNVNPRHADQMVRGSVVLPFGTGKTVRIAVFAKGEKATEAQQAGADVVGAEDLVARVTDGFIDFDVTVATPDMMGQVGRIGRVLGPRGLMPNPKAGTVTMDVAKIIKELKAGRVEFRVDKAGIIHVPIGKVSFDNEKLVANLKAITEMLAKLRPASAKAPYFRSMTISPTMGPGVKIDTSLGTQML